MMTTMSLVTSIPANVSVQLSNVKQSMTGSRLMTRKEYRDTHGLNRADAEKRHNQYLRENGVLGNAQIASMIAKGEILMTGCKAYEKSGKVVLNGIMASKVVDKAPVKAAVATEDETLASAAAFLGITVEALKALKAAK